MVKLLSPLDGKAIPRPTLKRLELGYDSAGLARGNPDSWG